MPRQTAAAIESNFTAGLKTEFTVLNFPENAATDTDNCAYTLIGDVLRREGIDFEQNGTSFNISTLGKAVSSFRWLNAGGDGTSQILVVQIGATLYFYLTSAATLASPISTQLLASTVTLNTATVECQYAEGNGYLFVFKADSDPFYCTYSSGVITATVIDVKVRDFTGIVEVDIPDNLRPLTLSQEHLYNIQNQGWTSGSLWTGTSTTSITAGTGIKTFTIQTGLTVTNGTNVTVISTDGTSIVMNGIVNSYTSGTGSLVLNISSFSVGHSSISAAWTITPQNTGYRDTFRSAAGAYPSNADVWWSFKDTTNTFNPAITLSQVTLNSGPAPKGSYILRAFNQDRGLVSGAGVTTMSTLVRPKTGAWFQGRVWYTGVDASFAATGDAPDYSWSETIYFSQIMTNVSQFGKCYQVNDPTSETLFDLLPSDGGTIVIQGCGSIYKLFPIQNGLLVFAANGIWFITGSQGIGFAATDYTITKISSIQSISSTSFVQVEGLPVFWNEEGIYSVHPSQQGGGLEVTNLALGTILSFYNEIPKMSKKYARGSYSPTDYIIKWVYRSTNESGISDRYQFNRILNYNVSNKAFFPYSVSGIPYIQDVKFIVNPGGSAAPDSTFKYLVASPSGVTFAEERDTTYVDWKTYDGVGTNYTSYFVTGFKAHGNAQRKFQPGYVYVFSQSDVPTFYKIQGIWNFANNRNSGKWSQEQTVTNALTNFGTMYRRHRIRGHGIALQFKITSVDGYPFDIVGWSTWLTMNSSI